MRKRRAAPLDREERLKKMSVVLWIQIAANLGLFLLILLLRRDVEILFDCLRQVTEQILLLAQIAF